MKICVFARYPRLGEVKSRLALDCGEQQALIFYQKMLEYTFRMLAPIKDQVCFYTTGCSEEEANVYFADFEYKPQIEGTLGEKLEEALKSEWSQSEDKLIFIGVDCLELKLEHIEEAIQQLSMSDVVIGPAEDGGYYLIGLSQMKSALFHDITWGTSRVFEQTVEKLNLENLSYGLLPKLNDVDYYEDLPKDWQQIEMVNDESN